MRLRAVAESLLERLVQALNMIPEPLLETQTAFSMARAVMVGIKLGVFEAAADGEQTAAAIAEICGTHRAATRKLLDALVACGYFKCRREVYTLTPKSRKWLLRSSPSSLRDKLLFQFYEWDMVAGCEAFVLTGKPRGAHVAIPDADYWGVYQKGMRSLAGLWAEDVARRLPVPSAARDMLDLGGSHGYFSVCLCRRYPQLKSVILDLPDAVQYAAPLLACENMGERVVHRVADVLSDDLGEACADIVFMSQLVHHFSEQQNRELMGRIARALRPAGVCVILDFVATRARGGGDQSAALLDLYFAMLSDSGTWAVDDMHDWFRSAGLEPLAAARFRNMPGGALVSGKKAR